MQVTTQDIVRSVARTIEADVLPDAAPGWPASYLRSSVMLLTYLEDRATLEPGLSREDDRELGELLHTGAQALDAPAADPALAAQIRDAIASEAGGATRETRRAALCDLIVAVYRMHRAEPSPETRALLDAIAKYRERALAREDLMWKRAEVLPLM